MTKRVKQHLETFTDSKIAENIENAVVNSKDKDKYSNRVMWVATKDSPAEGFDVLELDENRKEWLKQLINQNKISQKDIRDIYILDLPKTEQTVMVKFDFNKGTISYFDNNKFENSEENLYWEKPNKYKLLTISDFKYNSFNKEIKRINNNWKNSEGMKGVIQSIFTGKSMNNIDWVESAKDNGTIELYSNEHSLSSITGDMIIEKKLSFEGKTKDDIDLLIKQNKEYTNKLEKDILSIEQSMILTNRETSNNSKLTIEEQKRSIDRNNNRCNKNIISINKKINEKNKELLELQSEAPVFRQTLINFGFPLIGDKMIKFLILDKLYGKNTLKDNKSNSLIQIFLKLENENKFEEIQQVLDYLNDKKVDGINIKIPEILIEEDKEHLEIFHHFLEDTEKLSLNQDFSNYKLSKSETQVFYNFIFKEFPEFTIMKTIVDGETNELTEKEFKKRFKDFFNSFVENNLYEILNNEKLFPAILSKNIKEDIKKNSQNRQIVTDCRDSAELDIVKKISEENFNIIVIIPLKENGELKIENKEKIIKLYKESKNYDDFVNQVSRMKLVKGAEEMNTLFVINQYLKNNNPELLNNNINLNLNEKYKNIETINNQFGKLYNLTKEVEDTMKNMDEGDIKVSALITISAGGKDTVFSILNSLTNGGKYDNEIDSIHKEILNKIKEPLFLLTLKNKESSDFKNIIIESFEDRKIENVKLLCDTTLNEVYTKNIIEGLNLKENIDFFNIKEKKETPSI